MKRKLILAGLTAIVSGILHNYVDNLITSRINAYNDAAIVYQQLQILKHSHDAYDQNRRDRLI